MNTMKAEGANIFHQVPLGEITSVIDTSSAKAVWCCTVFHTFFHNTSRDFKVRNDTMCKREK